MATRFEMAAALAERSMGLLCELADEGSPYMRALETGEVTIALQVRVKEVFDHLRSALDYCAREVHARCVGGPVGNVYFPIAKKGVAPADFPLFANKKIPGLLPARPDVVERLASFQAFASERNEWMPEFATLCNENKHEQLSVAGRVDIVMTYLGDDPIKYVRMEKLDKTPVRGSPPIVVCRSEYPEGVSARWTPRSSTSRPSTGT